MFPTCCLAAASSRPSSFPSKSDCVWLPQTWSKVEGGWEGASEGWKRRMDVWSNWRWSHELDRERSGPAPRYLLVCPNCLERLQQDCSGSDWKLFSLPISASRRCNVEGSGSESVWLLPRRFASLETRFLAETVWTFFRFPLNRRRADKTKDRRTGSGKARRPPDDASFFAQKCPPHCGLSARPAWVSARELTRTLLPYLSAKGSQTSYSSAHSDVLDFSGVILQQWLLPCGKLSPSLNPIHPFQGTAG